MEETFILVEMTHKDATEPAAIKQIIRTFVSQSRAEEDRDLLREINPTGTYLVLTVNHIDD